MDKSVRLVGRPRGAGAPRLATQLDPVKIVEYRAAGFSIEQIAKLYGCSGPPIREVLRAAAARKP